MNQGFTKELDEISVLCLTEAEALQSRNQNGSNAVTTQEVESFSDKLLANLKDPIIII